MFHVVSRDRGVILYFWLCQHDVMDVLQRQDGGRGSIVCHVAFSKLVIQPTSTSLWKLERKLKYLLVLFCSECLSVLWLLQWFSVCKDLAIFGNFVVFFKSCLLHQEFHFLMYLCPRVIWVCFSLKYFMSDFGYDIESASLFFYAKHLEISVWRRLFSARSCRFHCFLLLFHL